MAYTDKKEKKIFLLLGNSEGLGAKSYRTNDLLMYGKNICALPHILGSPSSYMTLHLIPSEFPYIWGIFFISVISPHVRKGVDSK
jgi:hypothetical protein